MARAVGFEGANTIFQAPDGVPQEECYDLQCFVTPTEVISCWRLSEEELADVAKTGVVWLGVQSVPTPPVRISGSALLTIEGRPASAEPVFPLAPRKPETGKEPPEGPKTPETT